LAEFAGDRHNNFMARERSVVTSSEILKVQDGVIMSPIISRMLQACCLTLGSGGTTWVVCAPNDQGKSVAAHFLIHGNHTLMPKRSLKIDATNMKDFSKDFAKVLNCAAAQSRLSVLLSEALSDTAPKGDDAETRFAEASAQAMNAAGKLVCTVTKTTASDTKIC
jgi:hypothetical protein